MAETYHPFDAGAGSAITEGQWQKMARRWLNTGVVSSYLNTLAVTADGSAMSVSVNTGGAWIEGFYYENDAAKAMTVTAAHATLSRIDRVIVRLDRTANTCLLVVLAGTAAGSPVAPTLTVTDTLWEIGLATVLVDPAVGVIAANKVTDTRVLTGTYTQGLNANRPTVGFKLGRFFLATDTDVLHFDDGTAWHPISTTATADAAYPRKAAAWITGRAYILEELVTSAGVLYRVTTAHTSAGAFDATKFTVVGGAGAASLVQATRTTNLTMTASTLTLITFDVNDIDTDAFHSTSTNTSRITIPTGKAGKYKFHANLFITGLTVPSAAYAFFTKNGAAAATTANEIGLSQQTVGGVAATFQPEAILSLVAGDYVEVYALGAGAPVLNGTNGTGPAGCHFSATFLGT